LPNFEQAPVIGSIGRRGGIRDSTSSDRGTRLAQMKDQASSLLGIYLHDHLAASVAGQELIRRCHENEKSSAFGTALQQLREEIESDARQLRAISAALELGSRAPIKERAAWIGEKLGRLKLNGHLLRRSPLSLVLELEGLLAGVHGKRALWQTLIELAHTEPRLNQFALGELLARADDQLERLRSLHERAARAVFTEQTRGSRSHAAE
jgi:hypothetical protein